MKQNSCLIWLLEDICSAFVRVLVKNQFLKMLFEENMNRKIILWNIDHI